MSILHVVNRIYCSRLPAKQLTKSLKKSTLRAPLSTDASTSGRLKIDADNIVSSPFQDVKGYENIYMHDAVWKNVHKWADKTALVCSVTGKSYTYGESRKLCGRLATSFRKAKLLPHDTIALILPNIPEYAIVVLAASEAGLCTTTLNPEYDSAYMKKRITETEASAIVTTSSKYNAVKNITKDIKLKLPIIIINDNDGPVPEGSVKLEDLMSDGIEEFSKSEKTIVDYEDNVFLLFSSGTTGLPKGVQLSHRNIVVNLLQIGVDEINLGVETTETYQDVVPVMLPTFHLYGLGICMISHMRFGAKLIFMPQFTSTEFVKLVDNYRPTLLYLVPPIVQFMAQSEKMKPHHVERVRHIMSSASSVQEKTIGAFKNRLGSNVNFVQGYGMTETSPCITWTNSAPSDSVGYPVPNTQIRIVGCEGENLGRNLGVGQPGELYARGPQVMKGYFKNPEATEQTMDGDWIKTGDLASFSDKGLFYIEGRLKELIKVKGFQVAPAELEDIILSFDKVKDVAVIGIPHERYGEIPRAFIVPKDDVRLKDDDVKEFVAQRVIEYKQLGDVKFVDKIPKSLSGKILRNELKNM